MPAAAKLRDDYSAAADLPAFPGAGAEPGRERLAVHARQLALKPRLRDLRRHHRRRLRRLAKTHRPARNHNLHRNARLGPHRSDPMTLGISLPRIARSPQSSDNAGPRKEPCDRRNPRFRRRHRRRGRGRSVARRLAEAGAGRGRFGRGPRSGPCPRLRECGDPAAHGCDRRRAAAASRAHRRLGGDRAEGAADPQDGHHGRGRARRRAPAPSPFRAAAQ